MNSRFSAVRNHRFNRKHFESMLEDADASVTPKRPQVLSTFARFDTVVVPDNLREAVLSAEIYDPGLNPLGRDVLAHYGVTAPPCRVRDPDRKGKVESGLGLAQKTPLKGKRFESLEEAHAYLDHWEQRWADKRIHGRTKRQVAAMFAEGSLLCRRCRWSRSVITSTENAQFTLLAASK